MERELGPQEAMFVNHEQQANSEQTSQKRKRRGARKMGWKGFALQGENMSDLED